MMILVYILLLFFIYKIIKEGYLKITKHFLNNLFKNISTYIVLFFVILSIFLLDKKITMLFWKKINNIDLGNIAVFFQNLGKADIISIPLIILYFVGIKFNKNLSKISILALASNLYSGIFVQILKHIILRERPFVSFNELNFFKFNKIFNYTNTSFPSGHTITGFSVCFIFFYFYKNKKIRILCIIVASLIGIFRIYEGKHWLSDVIIGAYLGIIVAKTIYELNKENI
ncbi:undecaprenyl-diphosphatase [Hypnocyclicus thermotrophus]|uniref:Undecaprenyl-diphosphatase n=1 Tax=Hypnocyclicus thermotrophus TaxID=1627895 RepID=A0AA46I565_9FUSO|nr:phosphatase PAP2 family protein [Hypnocyclicus thermotrophus]TDT69107.1 undecaprenyl-diphosphatase [Hypnocyclicus thermotrophus]